MADQKHLRILKRGVEGFNKWRKKNPCIAPNLFKADLSGADLRRAKLIDADLIGADLSDADLSGADLRRAKLIDADLIGADLSDADLRRADLTMAYIGWVKYIGDKFLLTVAKLNGANFSGADLVSAKLRNVDLSGVDLSGVNLSGADLEMVKFRNVDLSGVDLSGVNLSYADLSRANLSGANLRWADLNSANINKANLSRAKISHTKIGNVDLSNVSGLESTEHDGPSTIGIDTIFRSGGKIPHKFLKNAGVPDVFIEYMGSLTGQALQYYSCFISYSNQDEEFAKRIHADLRENQVRCWFAPEDMKIGDEIRSAIEKEIRYRDKLLLVLSDNSISSEWVKDEVEAAYEEETRRKKTVLFPIRIDQSVMISEQPWAAKLRRQRNIGNFTNWKDHDSYQQAFKTVLRDLQAAEQ